MPRLGTSIVVRLSEGVEVHDPDVEIPSELAVLQRELARIRASMVGVTESTP